MICSNDLTAIGVIREAFELALDVPRDLSVVGFDDIRLAEFLIPPLTTVQMSQTAIAETAFRGLLEWVECERSQSSPEAGVIKTNLVLRRSTALAAHRMNTTSPTEQELAAERGRERTETPSAFA